MVETKTVTIVVNGVKQSAPGGLNVRTLLAHMGIDAERVAVELDREIVRRTEWDARRIENNSELEIVQFVGGG